MITPTTIEGISGRNKTFLQHVWFMIIFDWRITRSHYITIISHFSIVWGTLGILSTNTHTHTHTNTKKLENWLVAGIQVVHYQSN
jgi:hypothetical protein